MSKLLPVALALCGLSLITSECRAQPELTKRIKAVREVPIWQRATLNRTELKEIVGELRSTEKKTMQEAFKSLALARPMPAYADLVVREAQAASKESRDKFAFAMAFEIRRDWQEAKKAAETLESIRRNGGDRYLEQLLERGNASQVGAPLIAVAYSGDRRAPQLIARYWGKSKIPGLRALLIIGPPAAPELAKQLAHEDRFVRSDVVNTLAKIGTKTQIPMLEEAKTKADILLSRRIDTAIAEIRARSEEKP